MNGTPRPAAMVTMTLWQTVQVKGNYQKEPQTRSTQCASEVCAHLLKRILNLRLFNVQTLQGSAAPALPPSATRA